MITMTPLAMLLPVAICCLCCVLFLLLCCCAVVRALVLCCAVVLFILLLCFLRSYACLFTCRSSGGILWNWMSLVSELLIDHHQPLFAPQVHAVDAPFRLAYLQQKLLISYTGGLRKSAQTHKIGIAFIKCIATTQHIRLTPRNTNGTGKKNLSNVHKVKNPEPHSGSTETVKGTQVHAHTAHTFRRHNVIKRKDQCNVQRHSAVMKWYLSSHAQALYTHQTAPRLDCISTLAKHLREPNSPNPHSLASQDFSSLVAISIATRDTVAHNPACTQLLSCTTVGLVTKADSENNCYRAQLLSCTIRFRQPSSKGNCQQVNSAPKINDTPSHIIK